MSEVGSPGEVSVGLRSQETHTPEANAVEKLAGIMHFAGCITEPSRIAGRAGNIDRPLPLLNRRAELYKEAMESDSIRRKEIFKEAHDRDEIAAQYLNQGTIRVTMPELGTQEARYTRIDPPASRITAETRDLPPIFIIPGIANDIDCVGNLAQELPYMGRSVIVVSNPDASRGKVTDEFASAAVAAKNYEAHAAFYKQVIDGLIENDGEFELWGFSTGAPVSAEILNDPKFQDRVTEAVFLSPASTVDQSTMQITSGVLSETKKLVSKFKSLARYSLVLAKPEDKTPEAKAQFQRNKKATGGVMENVKQKFGDWKGAKVKEGGHITVVVGQNDELTKCYQGTDSFGETPQAKVLSLPEASHMTAITRASEVLPQVFSMQERQVASTNTSETDTKTPLEALTALVEESTKREEQNSSSTGVAA